jgi:hypothetical protein
MTGIKHAAVGLFLLTITASGLAAKNCPDNLPVQLLEDCLIYDSEGEFFPAGDYAYMAQYQEWLKTQQPKTAADPKY